MSKSSLTSSSFRSLSYALEARILFDGAGAATADAQTDDARAPVPDAGEVADSFDQQTVAVLHALTTVETDLASNTGDSHAGIFEISQDRLISSVINEARSQAETAINQFVQQASASQWFELFRGGQTSPDPAWSNRLDQLLAAINDGNFKVNVVEMDGASRFTAIAAYTREGPGGEPTVFINRFWFDMFDAPDAQRALTEEFGHAIDDYLNPDTDTQGDEGERFANSVLHIADDAATLSDIANDNDHGTVSVDGIGYNVEFASFNFVNAYQMITDVNGDGVIQNTENWAEKEQESHTLLVSGTGTDPNHGGLGAVSVNDDTNSSQFSGNDVSAIGINIGGTDYYGWISRPLKVQGNVVGFYFWTDQDFTNLASAQLDGNQDLDTADAPSDPGVIDNKGFILVVNQSYFTGLISGGLTPLPVVASSVWSAVAAGTYNTIEVGSSSDRVDSALNALVNANNAPVANADTANGSNGTTAAVEAGYGVVTVNGSGNVLSNDTDVNSDALVVSQLSTGNKSSTVSVTSNTPGTVTGQYGTLTLQANGTYSYVVNNANTTVDALQSGQTLNDAFVYTISDGKGGTASATLTIVINGSNDAPTANPDYNTAKESITGYTGYSATGDVTVNDTDVDDHETTKYIDGITVSGGASVGTVSVTSGTATLYFSGDSGFTANLSGRALYVNISGTYRAVYDASNNQVTLSSKVDQGSNNWLITLSATPASYDSNGVAGGDTAISNLSTFFTTNSSVGFEASTTPTENTSGMKTATVGTASTTGYTTLSNLSNLSGTIAVGMTVTSTDNTGVPVGTKISELTYTSGVLTSIKLDKELTSTTTGNFTFTTSATVGNTIQGAHGSLVLNSDGSYTYTPTTNNPYLSSGESAVEAFSYTMRDHVGGVTSSSTLYITIYGTGSSDPLLTNDAGTATETGVSAGSPATGNVLSNDKQTAAAGTAGTNVIVTSAGLSGSGSTTAIGSGETKTINGLYGALQLSSAGVYTYTVNDALATVNALAAGQSLTEVFNYRVANTASPTSQTWATLTVTLNGANDAPVTAVDTASVVEDSGVVPTGNLLGNDSDVDNDDSLTVANVIAGTDTNTFGAGNAVTAGTTSTSSPRTVTGSYGTLYVGADGSYRYVLDNNNGTVQALTPSSPAITDVFTYRALDTAGGSNTATLTVSITGTNETPINQFNGAAISSTSSTSVTTALNTAIDFTGSKLLAVGDADSNLDSITLEVEHGTLSFTSAPSGVSLSAASGGSITISAGSQTDLLAALALLRYTPDTGFYGTDFLSINSSDSVSARDIDGIAISIPMAFAGPTVKESDLSSGSNASGSEEVVSATLTPPAGQNFGTSTQSGSDTYGTWTLTTGGLFTYTLTSAPLVSGSLSTRTIDIITYDQFGNAITNTVTVTINDDTPAAVADTKSVTESTTAIGDVLTDGTDDAFYADGPKTTTPAGGVVGVRAAGGDISTPVTTGLDTPISGTYGTLTLSASGSYSYAAGAVSGTSTDTFVYTIEDADGDRSTTTLTFTILDSSAAPTLEINDVTVNEGAGTITFTVNRLGNTTGTSTVDYAFADGTATGSGTDYSGSAGTLTFAAGESSKTITVTINNDSVYEGTESFSVNLSNASGASISDSQGVGTIKDDGTGGDDDGNNSDNATDTANDDDRPSFSINDVIVNEAAGTLTFTVTKTGTTTQDATVTYAFVDDTATAGVSNDYTGTGGSLTFGASDTTKTVTVTINNDSVYEGSEAFNINLSNASGAIISDSQGVGTIKDDGTGGDDDGNNSDNATDAAKNDDRPTLSVSGLDVEEGSNAIFTVTLSNALAADTAIDLALSDIDTTSADYDGTSYEWSEDNGGSWNTVSGDQVILSAGKTAFLVRVATRADTPAVYEGAEALTLSAGFNAAALKFVDGVSGATRTGYTANANATLYDDGSLDGDDTGTGKDDDRLAFSINDVTVNEAAGTVTFTVTKTGSTTQSTTVDYAFTDGTATGNGTDYSATAGTLTFAAGDTSKTITVNINDDSIYEGSESFGVNLSNASGATISDSQGLGTIKDDGTGSGGTNDDRPAFSINDVTVNEAAGTVTFTVSKTGSTTQSATVDYAFTDGAAIGGGTDYSATAGTLTFAAGDTSKTITVNINDDSVYEGSESFGVNLSNASGATISDSQGLGTIKDDGTGSGSTNDDRPAFSINDVTVNEAAGTVTFTVSKTGSTAQVATVNYATVNGTATAGMDYAAVSGTLTFLAGETAKMVTIIISRDSVQELSETFNIELSNATHAVIGDNLGMGVITDSSGNGNNEEQTNVGQIVEFNKPSPPPSVLVTKFDDAHNDKDLALSAFDVTRPDETQWQSAFINSSGIHLSGDRDHFHQVWGEPRVEILEAKLDLAIQEGRYFKLPPEALMVLDTNDSLRFDAYLKNGEQLPDWIHLDRNDGSLSVDENAPISSEKVVVKVVATDTKGNQVTVTVILKPKPTAKPEKPKSTKEKPKVSATGKPALSEQLQATGQNTLQHNASEFLQRIARLFEDQPRA